MCVVFREFDDSPRLTIGDEIGDVEPVRTGLGWPPEYAVGIQQEIVGVLKRLLAVEIDIDEISGPRPELDADVQCPAPALYEPLGRVRQFLPFLLERFLGPAADRNRLPAALIVIVSGGIGNCLRGASVRLILRLAVLADAGSTTVVVVVVVAVFAAAIAAAALLLLLFGDDASSPFARGGTALTALSACAPSRASVY